MSFKNLRKKFPQIAFMDQQQEIYLDSASTSLKLDLVWETLKDIYTKEVSNVHRGEHFLSLKATNKYEQARLHVSQFISASQPEEIVFTSNSTESLNLLAFSLEDHVQKEDSILVSEMEHHSNFLPWQKLAQKTQAKFQVIPLHQDGTLNIQELQKKLSKKTKILSLTYVSNVTGVINPLQKIITLVRELCPQALIIIDAAQAAPLLPINVQKLDCDFLVFSGHKVFSPSGIGVLYGKHKLLCQLSTYKRGGGMILNLSQTYQAEWAKPPYKFEAGTPFIEGALVLGKVLHFLKTECDFDSILKTEQDLVLQAKQELLNIPQIKIIGSKTNYSNILSFVATGINSLDLSCILTQQKLALRAGSHCCLPLMQALNLKSGTVRASFSVYNREQDVLFLKKGIVQALKILNA